MTFYTVVQLFYMKKLKGQLLPKEVSRKNITKPGAKYKTELVTTTRRKLLNPNKTVVKQKEITRVGNDLITKKRKKTVVPTSLAVR